MQTDIALELEPETRAMFEKMDARGPISLPLHPRLGSRLGREYANAAGVPMAYYGLLLFYACSLVLVMSGHWHGDLSGRVLRLMERWAGSGLDPVLVQRLTVHVWRRLSVPQWAGGVR